MIISLHLLSTGVRPGGLASQAVSVLMTAFSPVQSAIARLSDNASDLVRNYFDLVGVRRENQRLKNEVAELKGQQSRVAELETDNRHLAELLALKDVLGVDVIGANVIGSDANGLSRTLILNGGSDDRIKPGMAVLSMQGVVGKVIATSPRASRVLLIDDHNSALDAFDQRTRARGIVAGIVDDGVGMRYVERSQDIRAGDVIVTSGLDGIFPRGLLVGTVKNANGEGPGLFLNVTLTPAVDFRGLEQVLVIMQTPPQLDSGPQS